MKTIRCWLAVLFFATCAGRVLGAETNAMVFRCYALPSFECEHLSHKGHEEEQREAQKLDCRPFLEKYGITFPPESFVAHEPMMNTLCMFNTEANQTRLKIVAEKLWPVATSVELDASYIAFDLPDIEAAARKNGSAAPTRQQIAELWKSGKGHLLATHKLITRSGVNAQSQGVDEQIYPTEFVKPDATNAPANAAASLPVPSSFETRESGMILNFTPTIQPDGQTIDLVLAPELSDGNETDDITTTLSRGEDNEESLIVRQPRFHTAKLTTTLAVKDGSTVIQGGMASRDGQSLIYLFLTTRIIGSDGQPIHPDAEAKPSEAAPKK